MAVFSALTPVHQDNTSQVASTVTWYEVSYWSLMAEGLASMVRCNGHTET